MKHQKKKHPKIKSKLHPRNKHRKRYQFQELSKSCPELAPFVKKNAYQEESIDFFNPQAVKILNKALLKHHYGLDFWDIPANYLCPPIPGRADYIHYIADLLDNNKPAFLGKKRPMGSQIKCLDIGVGANCVYPIIGQQTYGWSFIGTDIDPIAIQSANKIVALNPTLQNIELRLQKNPKNIFRDILQKGEFIDCTICNPPFHASAKEAQAAAMRKLSNLKRQKIRKVSLNFGGQSNELWCEGGEKKFVQAMIIQSKELAHSCLWFSTLISKQSNLKSAYSALKKANVVVVKTMDMGQGNKVSRIVAWTFLSTEVRQKWMEKRWKG